MHLLLCDKTFGIVSQPIDNFQSVIWTQRWYDAGECKAVLPATYFDTAVSAAFLYNSDLADYMLIENVEVDSATETLTVSGVSLESMFDWRPMWPILSTTADSVEDTARYYVNRHATGASFAYCAFVNTPVILGSDHAYTETVTVRTVPGVLLSDAIRFLYKPLGWAYTLKRQSGTANLIFDTVKGLDRRSTQSINPKAIFMTTKDDISSYRYSINNKDYRNYVYLITSWTTGTPGTTHRQYDESIAGDERKIIYWRGDQDYTTAELDTIGRNELTKYPVSENISGEISPGCLLVYGTDYSLGDYCDVVINEIGLTYSAQITAVDTVYELGTKKVYPTFGEEKFNLRKVIKREAGR